MSTQADYEVHLVHQFKKLDQFWQNKGSDKFVSKCVFLLEAYGVSPSLSVGFEEALFLANKIKSSLGGSLSTEKVLYLLFITLQKKQEPKKNADRKSRYCGNQIEEISELEKDTTTFRSFIIRYLYFLREQSIVNQVQKMGSMEQVRAAFRSKADAYHLQFHQIEALNSTSKSGAETNQPPKPESEGELNHKMFGETDHIGGADKTIVASSRLNPELCARNSHGQFVNRKKDSQDAQLELTQMRRRDLKNYKKEAKKNIQQDRIQGVLGKRTRKQAEGLCRLQDTPEQVFIQRADGEVLVDSLEAQEWRYVSKTQKQNQNGVSSDFDSFTNQNSNWPSNEQELLGRLTKIHTGAAVKETAGQVEIGILNALNSVKIHKQPILGLLGGNPSSKDSASEYLPSKQHASQDKQSSIDQEASESQKRSQPDQLSDQTLTEKSVSGQVQPFDQSENRQASQQQSIDPASNSVQNNLAQIRKKRVQGSRTDQSNFTQNAREAVKSSPVRAYSNNRSMISGEEYEDDDGQRMSVTSSDENEPDDADDESFEEEEEYNDEGEISSRDVAEKEINNGTEQSVETVKRRNFAKQPLSKTKTGKRNRQPAVDVDMKDEQDGTSELDSSLNDTGAITKCYTVFKLEPKRQNGGVKQNKVSGKQDHESDTNTCKEDSQSKKSGFKSAGIYRMLMMVTQGLNEKKRQNRIISGGATASYSRESQNRQKKEIHPQQLLYMEQDIKVALSQQTQTGKGGVSVVKRRQGQNYLSYSEPFDLNFLLDEGYWIHQATRLTHSREEIIRLSALNKLDVQHTFEREPIHEFLDFKESVESAMFKVRHLFWQNDIDAAVPYQSGFKEHFWNYIQQNEIVNNNIRQYLQKVKRQSFCNCLDGCQNSRKCPCYKFNRKLQNPTYNKQLSPRSGSMIAFQQRAKTSINKVFSFNECHPRCSCNKDLCQNYLVAAQNKKKFKFLIRRIQKTLSPIYQEVQEMDMAVKIDLAREGEISQNSNKLSSEGIFSQHPKKISMWGLIAMEEIPAGAFLMEYLGEIVSKKQGDMRGTFYDANGLSYLFDLNDLSECDEKEQFIQKVYYNEFFPLCLDSMFYGNEARFINHSCDPNVQSFNLTGQVDSNVYHSIGLFASRKIMPGEELNLDYQWDKNDLTISQDVPCLCGSVRCRGFLMRAKKQKKQAAPQNAVNFASQVTSKQDSQQVSIETGKESNQEVVSVVSSANGPLPQTGTVHSPKKVAESKPSPGKIQNLIVDKINREDSVTAPKDGNASSSPQKGLPVLKALNTMINSSGENAKPVKQENQPLSLKTFNMIQTGDNLKDKGLTIHQNRLEVMHQRNAFSQMGNSKPPQQPIIFNPVIIPPQLNMTGPKIPASITLPPASQILKGLVQQDSNTSLNGGVTSEIRRLKQVKNTGNHEFPSFKNHGAHEFEQK